MNTTASLGRRAKPDAEPQGNRKRVLMVAFHYPPCFGSSGVLRTLKFSRYLPGEGWDPVVLTANPRAYQAVNPAQLGEIPEEVEVARAFALDSRRHLAIRGKSLGLTAIPDQWSTWVAGAVPRGLRLLRRYRPEAIWSTYPIASAHLIGLLLHRLSGIPWVADFRDMMLDEAYPRARSTRLAHRWIERHVVTNAARLVFTAPSTEQLYLYRYPTLERARCQVIRNGYDEVDFADLSPRPSTRAPDDQPVRLVHSGLIYEEERDPRPFLRTLARLRGDGLVRAASLRVDLRASGSEERFRGLVRDMGLGEIVHLLPPLPYREALRDSADASALLILQGPSCDRQIPAKAYEYLRMGKPILGLTTRDGDTGRLLAECGGTTLLPLLDEEALYGGLPAFLDAVRRHRHPVPDPAATARYARQYQAKELAACLDQVAVGVGARST